MSKRIFVAGHKGMVGSAIVRRLKAKNDSNIIVCDKSELDLLDPHVVSTFFQTNNIDQVYLAAAKVGGIYANNTFPAEFIYQNLMIQTNVINAAHQADIQQLLFLGSSCIYPKSCEQPISESYLLSGKLESTNEPYAIAKIAGIKLCESYNRQYGRDYRSIMPSNLYGPNDNFHPKNSHVIPALMLRFHQAVETGQDEVIIWGTGNVMREFLHVDDMASACVFLMEQKHEKYASATSQMSSHINVGTGVDCSIRELAETMAEVTGFTGALFFDIQKPDGTPRKLLDVSRLKTLGWSSEIDLAKGLYHTYQWFLESRQTLRD